VYFIERKIILVSGKGGVGRTAISAALAKAAAKAGRRTLVLEIGYEAGAQSALGTQFSRRDLSDEPVLIGTNLFLGRLSARTGHAEFLRTILPSKALIAAALRSKAVQKFLVAAPSLHEMGIFYHLLSLTQKTRKNDQPYYDLVIVDMPATGHTLALTGLPKILLRLIPGGPIAKALHYGQSLLNDPQHGEAWIVTLPEKLPVTEACELVAGLRETNISVGGIILNRMPLNPFTHEERLAMAGYLEGEDFFGQLTLERIDAAQVALTSLKSQLDIPVLVLPEQAETVDTVQGLAHRFSMLIGSE
jgi:arsenite-transporting ATPase